MGQSLSKVLIHLIFATKNRQTWLKDQQLRGELHAYMAAMLRDGLKSPATIVGGVEDHVHVLFDLSRSQSLMEVVKNCKTETAKWIKRQAPHLADFQWQAGYGAFSVSQSNAERVASYIANQAEHHRKLSFQEEFLEICRRHGVEVDERYVWE